ncbi:unnamed protein product, partial [Heterosigma akashiwo]
GRPVHPGLRARGAGSRRAPRLPAVAPGAGGGQPPDGADAGLGAAGADQREHAAPGPAAAAARRLGQEEEAGTWGKPHDCRG